ncbi:MAG: hypothetical protein NUV77_15535 [Thermoguttaceae bacterium]|jgi:hypothetical protein|nr:hypothetical protein [Thermoguttaceae bacterium]
MAPVEDLYERTIRPLPADQRLRLATMILNDIPPQAVVDYREEWTEEDYRDLARATWGRVETEEGGRV